MSTSLASLGVADETAVLDVDFSEGVSHLMDRTKGNRPFVFAHPNINGRVPPPCNGIVVVRMQLLKLVDDMEFDIGLKVLQGKGKIPGIHELAAFTKAFPSVLESFRIATLDPRYKNGAGKPAFPFVYPNCAGRCLDLRSTRHQLDSLDWAFLVVIQRG